MTRAPSNPPGTILPVALLAVLALAGCSGGSDEPVVVEVAPGQSITVSEAPKPSNGIVSGIVGDDALYPLPGATIWILGLNKTTVTDDNGRFALVDVPPGVYILEGSKKDHATVQTTADVQSGQTARAVLLLERLPSSDPYHVTFHQEAFVEATAAGIAWSSDNTSLSFTLDESRAVTLVVESSWDGIIHSAQSDPLTYDLQEVGLRSILTGSAPNPFSYHWDARILPPGHDRFIFSVEPNAFDPTVMAQSRGDLLVTVFYNEAAPPGWSVLAGNT